MLIGRNVSRGTKLDGRVSGDIPQVCFDIHCSILLTQKKMGKEVTLSGFFCRTFLLACHDLDLNAVNVLLAKGWSGSYLIEGGGGNVFKFSVFVFKSVF